MRYLDIKIANEVLSVSRLALGTFGYGFDRFVTLKDSFRMIDCYLDMGGNVLDCGRVYIGGVCEEAVGKYLKARNNRDKFIISTKGCHPPQDNMKVGRLSIGEMKKDLEASLKALNTDYVEFYWLHKDDRTKEVGEIIEDANELMKAGKIGAIGCSNWSTDRIEAANRYAKEHGLKGFEHSQIQWSLAQADQSKESFTSHLDVVMTDAEYDWYLRNNMTVFAWGSQAHALFRRAYKAGWDNLPESLLSEFGMEENKLRFEKVKEYSRESGLSLSQIALAYITCNSLPGIALIGCKNEEQLLDSMSAADTEIDVAILEKLRNI